MILTFFCLFIFKVFVYLSIYLPIQQFIHPSLYLFIYVLVACVSVSVIPYHGLCGIVVCCLSERISIYFFAFAISLSLRSSLYLHVYLFVYLCFCLCFFLRILHLSLCSSLYFRVSFVSFCVFISTLVFIRVPTSLSVHLPLPPMYPSIYPSIYASMCLFVFSSFKLFVNIFSFCLCTDMCVYPFILLS